MIWWVGTLKCMLVEVEVHVGRAPLCRDWQARHLEERFNFLSIEKQDSVREHLDTMASKTYQCLGEISLKSLFKILEN